MAATVDSNSLTKMVPELTNEIRLSSLTAGTTETLSHKGPTGVAPSEVAVETTTVATDGSAVNWTHTADSTTSNTTSIKFDTAAGGSLSGAKVKIRLTFYPQASGGLSPPF